MKAAGQKIEIKFDYLETKFFTILTPGKSMGLQLSDAISGAIFNACERSYQKNGVDADYLQAMVPIFYQRKGKLEPYGLKFFPKPDIGSVLDELLAYVSSEIVNKESRPQDVGSHANLIALPS